MTGSRMREVGIGIYPVQAEKFVGVSPTQSYTVLHDPADFLFHIQKLDVKHQGGIRRDNATCAARAVAQFGRNHERALAPHLHARHALVPALDHPSGAQRERKRAPADRTVELLSALLLRT